MFVLRRITSESEQVNESIGKRYRLIISINNKDEFKRVCEIQKVDEKEVFGFIGCLNGYVTLYRTSQYFMMNDNGDTFDNLNMYK